MILVLNRVWPSFRGFKPQKNGGRKGPRYIMYSIVFGLVVTGGMLVMVAVGPSQGRGPA